MTSHDNEDPSIPTLEETAEKKAHYDDPKVWVEKFEQRKLDGVSYAGFVHQLAKNPGEINATLDLTKLNLLHMVIGISGEAGELLDQFKKHVVYNKPLNRENVVEELGDLVFYMQGMMNTLLISWDEIFNANIAKLKVRYAAGYSDKAAQKRADKKDGES